MSTAGCTPISSHKVLGGWLLPNLTSDLHPGRPSSRGSLGTGYPLLADPGGCTHSPSSRSETQGCSTETSGFYSMFLCRIHSIPILGEGCNHHDITT